MILFILSISIILSIYHLSIYLSMTLSLYCFIYLPIHLSLSHYLYLPINISVNLSIDTLSPQTQYPLLVLFFLDQKGEIGQEEGTAWEGPTWRKGTRWTWSRTCGSGQGLQGEHDDDHVEAEPGLQVCKFGRKKSLTARRHWSMIYTCVCRSRFALSFAIWSKNL